MKKLIRDLLSESSTISTMRLMALVSLAVGALVAIYGVYKGKDLGGIAEVCTVFVGSAFSAKVVQKFGEKNQDQ